MDTYNYSGVHLDSGYLWDSANKAGDSAANIGDLQMTLTP